jgi:hypothetical protein
MSHFSDFKLYWEDCGGYPDRDGPGEVWLPLGQRLRDALMELRSGNVR